MKIYWIHDIFKKYNTRLQTRLNNLKILYLKYFFNISHNFHDIYSKFNAPSFLIPILKNCLISKKKHLRKTHVSRSAISKTNEKMKEKHMLTRISSGAYLSDTAGNLFRHRDSYDITQLLKALLEEKHHLVIRKETRTHF